MKRRVEGDGGLLSMVIDSVFLRFCSMLRKGSIFVFCILYFLIFNFLYFIFVIMINEEINFAIEN